MARNPTKVQQIRKGVECATEEVSQLSYGTAGITALSFLAGWTRDIDPKLSAAIKLLRDTASNADQQARRAALNLRADA
jgi:hypothetical protein